MANLGDIKIALDYQVQKQGPLDARLTRKTKADLIDINAWPHEGNIVYVYKTMLVGIEDTGEVYKLVDPSKMFESDYSGWEKVGTGGGGGASAEEIYIGSEEPTDDKYKVWINPDENPEGSTNPGGSESTGSSQTLKVWIYYEDISELTQEKIDENISTYNSLLENPNQLVCTCDGFSIDYPEEDYYASMTGVVPVRLISSVVKEGEQLDAYFVLLDYDEGLAYYLNSDGSIIVDYESTFGYYGIYIPIDGYELSDDEKDVNITSIRSIKSQNVLKYGIRPMIRSYKGSPINYNETGAFGFTSLNSEVCSFLIYINGILRNVKIVEATGETTVVDMIESTPATASNVNNRLLFDVTDDGGIVVSDEQKASNSKLCEDIMAGKVLSVVLSDSRLGATIYMTSVAIMVFEGFGVQIQTTLYVEGGGWGYGGYGLHLDGSVEIIS